MKKLLLSFGFVTATLTLLAQDQKDEQAIRAQVQAMINSWNKHDYSDMKNYTTADVEWVNVVGMHWKGQKEVVFAHQAFHNTIFRNLPMELKSIATRFLTNEVALVHMVTHYGEYTTPGGIKRGNNDDVATLVFVKRDGVWLLTAGENVSVEESAKEHNPIKWMPVDK